MTVANVPLQAERWLARYASMEDLPPEGATEEELAKLPVLRAAVLRLQGRDSPPEGWASHFYLRAPLLRFLRGRAGDVEQAAQMVADAMKWFEEQKYWEDGVMKYERDTDPAHKELLGKYSPEGYFGVDKRGMHVMYFRMGLKDTAGLIREVGQETIFRSSVYNIERDLDHGYQLSVAAGVAFMGCITVLDLDGITWSRGQATISLLIWFAENLLKDRFPESTRVIYLVNAPWYFNLGWKLVSPFIPAATKEKMQPLGSDYLSALQEHIDIDQIPTWLGGTSTEPWPWGEGGDVPNTKGEDAIDGGEGIVVLHVSRQETVRTEVPAGHTCGWEFRVHEHDVDVSVLVDGEITEPARRVASSSGWQSGRMAFAAGGTVELDFDNSFSWMRTKTVSYRFFVAPAEGAKGEATRS